MEKTSLREFLRTFAYIGVNSFGGPAGQIAVMHRVLVDEKKWLSESRFLHALNYCMLLPGPEAMQLATYAGWLTRGTWGGIVSGLLFVLPGALVMLALSAFYAAAYDVALVAAIFAGVKPAVLAVVLEALLRVGRRALTTRSHVLIAVAAFAALFLFAVPFPLVILGAGLLGLVWGRANVTHDDADGTPAPVVRPVRHVLQVVLIWGTIWWAPVLLAHLMQDPLLVTLGQFFSKAAMVTFGGAYAVLSFILQEAVHTHRWLSPEQMMAGLGLAETTPGPLILVNQFVGYLAGAQHSHPEAPWWGGVLGAGMATWCTFVPCFLWIFLGAPFIEQLRGNQRLSAALSGITAAVVGVIGNLSVWFALHAVFGTVTRQSWGPLRLEVPAWNSLSPMALALAVLAAVLLLRLKVPMLAVLALCGAVGAVLHLLIS